MAALQTIKEGHLYKRGKINTEWRQRLFVLNGKQLSYFKGGVSTISMEYRLGILIMAIPGFNAGTNGIYFCDTSFGMSIILI